MKHLIALLIITALPAVHADDQKLVLPLPGSGIVRFDIADYLVPLEAHGDAGVCLWEDEKQGAFTVTDDGMWVKNAGFWKAVMDTFRIPVTFFVNALMDVNWDTARALYDKGHSIQSHSGRHQNNFTYYVQGKDSVESAIGNTCYTLAYPGGADSVYIDSAAMAGHNGCRGVTATVNRVIKTDYLNSHSSSSFNMDGIRSWGADPKYGWKSYHLHGLTDAAELMVWEQMQLLDSLADKLWLAKYKDVSRYGQERDTHTLTVQSVEEDLISFTLSDSMHDSVFIYPLSVKVRVEGWDSVKATQNGETIESELKTDDLGTYALVKAVPDQGEVVLSSGRTSYISQAPAVIVPAGNADGVLYDLRGTRNSTARQGMYLRYDPATGALHKTLILE